MSWATHALALAAASMSTLAFGCAAETDHGLCDVRELLCQRDLVAELQLMRGRRGPLPPVRLIDRAEFFALTEPDEPPSDDERIRQERFYRGLSLFDLAPKELEAEQLREDVASEVLAAYGSDPPEIVIVDEGQPLDTPEAHAVLVHELVHAAQDAELDLVDFFQHWGTTYDRSLAAHALTEGEAAVYEAMLAAERMGFADDEIDWRETFNTYREQIEMLAVQDPSPFAFAHVRFPYAQGPAYVRRSLDLGGREAVDALFARPPASTREVMYGAREDDPQEVATDLAAFRERGLPLLDAAFEQVDHLALGAWIATVFGWRMAGEDGPVLAHTLRADVFSVHVDPATERVIAAWRVRTRYPEALDLWPAPEPSVVRWTDVDQRDLYMLGGDPDTPADAQLVDWQPVPEEEAPTPTGPPPPPPSAHLQACSRWGGPVIRALVPTVRDDRGAPR